MYFENFDLGSDISDVIDNPEDYGLILLNNEQMESKESITEYFFSNEDITIPDGPSDFNEDAEMIVLGADNSKMLSIEQNQKLLTAKAFIKFIENGGESDKEVFKALVEEYMSEQIREMRVTEDEIYYYYSVEKEIDGSLEFYEDNGGLTILFIIPILN